MNNNYFVMKQRVLRRALSGILLYCFLTIHPAFAADAADIQQLLESADSIRSSDPYAFQSILAQLKTSSHRFTAEQQSYYDYLQAYKLSFTGEFNEAVVLYKGIINSNAPTLLKFRANLSIVNIYAISKNWTEGLTHLSINQKMLPEIQDEEINQLGLLVAAMFYNQLGQYELGLSYAQKLDTQVKHGRNYCFAKQLSLEAKFKLKLLSEHDNEIQQGLDACNASGEMVMVSAIYTYIAALHLNNRDTKNAISVLKNNLATIEKTQYAPILSYYYSLLAQSFETSNNTTDAEKYALLTLVHSKNQGNNEPTIIANKVLYHIAESRGDHQQALAYHKQYAAADKAYLDDIKTKHLAFQLAQHQATEQQNKIQLLGEQNNLLRLKHKLARSEAENNRLFIALLIASVTLLLGFVYKSSITHKRLKQLAEYDALTGVFNRGHFTQVAVSAIDYSRKSQQSASCILFDLDDFKSVNDLYGHACGDWILKKIAAACQANGRNNDIFARLGGEEFCIFLPGCDLFTAAQLAEECRKIIENIDTQDSGFDFTITASFGVTDFGQSGFNLDKLIADADAAMYMSKKAGRNRVTLYSDGAADLNLNMTKEEHPTAADVDPATG